MIFVLLFMLFLGPVQVISAIVALIATRNPLIRMHMGFYLAGVLAYFVILAIFGSGGLDIWIETVVAIHFFGSAALLAVYHVAILVSRGQLFGLQAAGDANADPFAENA